MKKVLKLVVCILMLCACFDATAFADTLLSEYWSVDDAGRWHLHDAAGVLQTNCWVCDDAAGPSNNASWYLIDRNGNVVCAPLVLDSDGNYFSLSPDGAGLATLRCRNGLYDGIPMQFSTLPGTSFGVIANPDAVASLLALYSDQIVMVEKPAVVYTSKLEDVVSGGCGPLIPRTGELYHNPGYLSSSANFTINNARGAHTLIKLYSTGGELVSTVFIRKGEKLKIYIPGGTYRMKQAFGEEWYGENDLFGPEGKYWMCSVNGSYDIPLKRAGMYVLSTTGSGQAISKQELDSAAF